MVENLLEYVQIDMVENEMRGEFHSVERFLLRLKQVLSDLLRTLRRQTERSLN